MRRKLEHVRTEPAGSRDLTQRPEPPDWPKNRSPYGLRVFILLGTPSMRHNPAKYHIRVPIRAYMTFPPIVDHPLLPRIVILRAPIEGRNFQRELHAVGVRGAVIGEL